MVQVVNSLYGYSLFVSVFVSVLAPLFVSTSGSIFSSIFRIQ